MDPIESRERLYDAFADSDRPIEERIQEGLDLGTEFLNLPIGWLGEMGPGSVTRIRGQSIDYHGVLSRQSGI